MLKLNILVAGILLALAAAPACAQAHVYKCKDSKGKTYYTQTPPTECLGKEMDELSKQGTVVKKREAALTPEQLAAREACLLYTSPSPRDRQKSRMPSSA